MRWALPILLLCSNALADDGGAIDPDAPRVGASLDRTEAHVGDRLTLTVSAVARTAQVKTVRLPSHLDLGKFEVLDTATSDRDLGDGNGSRRFVLQVADYETGEIELPPVVLEYEGPGGAKRTVETTSIPVQLTSLIGDDPQAEVQPLKGTREVMVEDRRIYTGLIVVAATAGGLVILAIAISIYRRRKRRPAVAPIVPLRPPEEIALERLDELRRRGAFEVDGYRPFNFAVAEIIRAYLGARFQFDALEMTTTELCAALEEITDDALLGQRIALRQFLESTDLVKFAKAGSTDADARAALDAAEAIVKATRPVAPAAVTEKIAPAPPEVANG